MATIKDVARAAGVSVATVSRVYNGSAKVRDDTRDIVRQVATELGYSPNAAARSLITSRSHTIGVLLPDLYGEFFSEVIRGIDLAAQRSKYHLLLSSARHDGPDLEAALRSMRGRVDGLLVMSPELDAGAARRGLPENFPVILLNAPANDAGFGSMAVENFEGARAMVAHLAGLGHRRIALIRGAERNFDAEERLRGYRAALAAAGIAADRSLEFAGDFSEQSGHEAARAMLARPDRPTAVFAANDCMAIGALSALREAGLRVPQDMALGGFDDIPMGRYLEPALTSVHVDISALGERATVRLLDALQDSTPRDLRRETLPTTLVVRRSCGAHSG